MNKFKKGDIVKTSLSDKTIILEVKNNDALLFNRNQFVVANNIKKDENDFVYWEHGDYYHELPDDPFKELRYDNLKVKNLVNKLIDINYEGFTKALMSKDLGVENEDTLNLMYEKFINNDDMAMLISDRFIDFKEEAELPSYGIKKNMDHLEDEWEMEI